MVCHPCILGHPQRQAWRAKSEVVPNIGEQNLKWLPHPCLLGGPKERTNATSPVHSRGSPTPSWGAKSKVVPNIGDQNLKWPPHSYLLGGPTKIERAASLLLSRRPNRGRKCYVTRAFSGMPNAKCGEQNQKWPPTKGIKIKSGYLTCAFSGAQKRAEMVRHPCILGDPQHQAWRAKSEVVPNIGEQNLKWLPHPCLLEGPKEGRNSTSPLHSRGSPTPSVASKIRSGPQHRGTKSEVAASPLPYREPKRGYICYVTRAF